MATIHDVQPQELIELAAAELAKNDHVKAPEWARFVKTGVNKERVPMRKDWWQVRAAAVLRTVYRYGPIGVSKLRTRYGSKKRHGYKPPHFERASGNILRTILQQLEKAGYVAQNKKSQKMGRIVTPSGKSFLDKLAGQITKRKPVIKAAPAAAEKQEQPAAVKKESAPQQEKA